MPDRNSEMLFQNTQEVRSILYDNGLGDMNSRADRVNRTHRVVRERAKTLRARRSKIRSLWLPLSIFSLLLVGICMAVWSGLDQYEITPTGTPVASYQMLVLLLWSVPVSAALLAVVLFRQSRTDACTRGRY